MIEMKIEVCKQVESTHLQQPNPVQTVSKSSFGMNKTINYALLNRENNLLSPWDISLDGSVPWVLVGVSLGVWLESSSGSALPMLFTLLLFSLSTSSSSSIVHWRARLRT